MSVLMPQQHKHIMLKAHKYTRCCYRYKLNTGGDFVACSRINLKEAAKEYYKRLERCKIDPVFHAKFHYHSATTARKLCTEKLNCIKRKPLPVLERIDPNKQTTGVVVR